MTAPPPLTAPETCDIAVIGGGPAGSTAAALLARRGRRVVLLDKDRHPRFHIGESLLPRNLAIFDRLGVRSRVHALGTFKPGAEFVCDKSGRQVTFSFASGLDRRYTHCYQVPRAAFDATLLDTARASGATVLEATRVHDVAFAADGTARLRAQCGDGQERAFAARFVLDASGRDCLLARKFGLRVADKRINSAAVYGHFRNVEARTDERAGCVSVHLVKDGWFWMIPLPGDIMSVGFVSGPAAFKDRAGGMQELLMARVAASPSVAARMRAAEPVGEIVGTGNYSYRTRAGWGEGWMLLGDAFGFLDPVFSSGVLLAMASAELGAEVAETWLDDPAAARTLARRADRRLRRAMDELSWLIGRINDPVLRGMLLAPRNLLHMRDGLVSVLAGHFLYERPGFGLPLAMFKATYYLLAGARRLGVRTIAP
ncbi:MAG: tryptophan 7-halogenase [Rhodospirillales bacterium]|jgi:flavin-dependent dehydrogenase|nr:tryptophan 7-halogenase [Rhodospirillales bacterium]